MAANRPHPDELLAALAEQLDALAKQSPPGRYALLMARNAARILQREAELGPAAAEGERAGLRQLLASQEDDLAGLNRALCDALRQRRIAADAPRLLAHLRASAEARLAIDNPRFLTPASR